MDEPQHQTEAAGAELPDRLERMFRATKFDHPDLIGGIVWSDCELAWINERITLAMAAEREACAKVCDDMADKMEALLADISNFRDQCRTAQRDLIPAADPTGDARMAYGVAADQLDALIKRHGV